MLQRGDEGELDRLPLLVAGLWTRGPLQAEAGVWVGLEPNGVVHRIGGPVMGVGGGCVVDQHDSLRPSLDRAQAPVGGDAIQPGTKRASTLEPCEAAPSAKQRLLQCILGVGCLAEFLNMAIQEVHVVSVQLCQRG